MCHYKKAELKTHQCEESEDNITPIWIKKKNVETEGISENSGEILYQEKRYLYFRIRRKEF